MTALAAQLAGRDAADAIVTADGRSVDVPELSRTGLSDRIGPEARVALCLHDPLALIAALVALDGRVDAILLLSATTPADVVARLVQGAGCDLLVSDRADLPAALPLAEALASPVRPAERATQWLMTTSGTTGLPKIVPHSLASLQRSVRVFPADRRPVWGLLYDPTRFAGLQVVLQALLGGGRLLAVDSAAPLADQLAALAAGGCTHLSATPTLWRRLLMVPGHDRLPLQQITLGGEIADTATLSLLRAAFPQARISHIYASTEAGVGFSVTDGRAGFPASYLDEAPGGVRLKVTDDLLWIRPPVTALTAGQPGVEIDSQGYVRTGDLVAVAGDRVTFLGRENGLINIAGVKVYPETVEAVIRAVPGVLLVQVSAKRSPLTGALVVAEIQMAPGLDPAEMRRRVQDICRARLPREAVPALIRFVDDLAVNSAGKLTRTTSGAPA